jgi:hypothetical protein
MSLKRIAELIPPEYRKEILELDMIGRAIGQTSDPTMHYLATIWTNYIEPDFTGDCNLCMGRVLDNFKQMKNILVEMEKEMNLLKQV